VWLPHSSLSFQRPVGRRSYHNKPRLTGEVCVTPQATIALACVSLNLVVSGVKLRTVTGPQLRRKEVESFALQQLDFVERKMH